MYKELQPVLDHFHGLIEGDLAAAEQQLIQLQEGQKERRILFGDRPLAHSLRPTFITEGFYTRLQDSLYLIRQAILQIAAEHFNSQEAIEELDLKDWELSLISIPTNVIRLSATARMDAFLTSNSFKFVELNAESPAGIGYIHELAKVYRQLPVFQEFIKKYPVRFVSPLQHLVAGLLRIYHDEFSGREERPTFCIVDKLDIPTIHEFHIIKDYINGLGFECLISDPRDLELRDGFLYCEGVKIDILYRRLLTNEFWEIKDQCEAFLEGYKLQKTCFINTFRSKLVHKKSIFSFLTDARYNQSLNHVQMQVIREHIPWTRKLRQVNTNYRGRMIDLIEYVREHKDLFVLKPNDEYGGKGVSIGFTMSQHEWVAALSEGLKLGYVVQETVDIHREPFLLKGDNAWSYVPTVVDLDPYLNGPLMGGCLTRTSSSHLANVTAGGGTLPTFILRYFR